MADSIFFSFIWLTTWSTHPWNKFPCPLPTLRKACFWDLYSKIQSSRSRMIWQGGRVTLFPGWLVPRYSVCKNKIECAIWPQFEHFSSKHGKPTSCVACSNKYAFFVCSPLQRAFDITAQISIPRRRPTANFQRRWARILVMFCRVVPYMHSFLAYWCYRKNG